MFGSPVGCKIKRVNKSSAQSVLVLVHYTEVINSLCFTKMVPLGPSSSWEKREPGIYCMRMSLIKPYFITKTPQFYKIDMQLELRNAVPL